MASAEWRIKELNNQIQELYEETGSVRKVAEVIGLCKSVVHRRLQDVGLTKPTRFFLQCAEPECSKPTGGKQLCSFHWRVRKAAHDVKYRQRMKHLTVMLCWLQYVQQSYGTLSPPKQQIFSNYNFDQKR